MPRPKDFIPLQEAHYSAIGRVAVEWTAIEGMIAYGVRVLLGPSDNAGRTVTANTQFMAHCDILRALLHVRRRQISADVPKICKFIEDLGLDKPNHDDVSKRKSPRARRNEIIHGSWVGTEDPRQFYTVTYKARGKLKTSLTQQSAKKISDFADELAGLGDQLWDMLIPILDAYLKSQKP